jgi:glycosyltransferase involved in cell wall biosynthesis
MIPRHAACPSGAATDRTPNRPPAAAGGGGADRFRPIGDAPRNGRLPAIGRLVEQKGYEVLIEALASLPPAQRPVIDVVGAGENAATLAAQVAARGVGANVQFLGPRPSEWIAAEGPRSLGLVAPYVICRTGDRDTGPVVVKEATCMGLPVVASHLMGRKETVDGANGPSVPPGNVAALAEALLWIAGLDEATRHRLGAAGRERAIREHPLRGHAEGLVAAIRTLAPHAPPG